MGQYCGLLEAMRKVQQLTPPIRKFGTVSAEIGRDGSLFLGSGRDGVVMLRPDKLLEFYTWLKDLMEG